jgi:26S proteasome regulatory subunit N4
MLASLPHRRSQFNQPSYPQPLTIPQQHQHLQQWSSPATTISTPQPQYATSANSLYTFGTDQPLFDYQPQQYTSSQPQSLMQTDSSWLENGQLTPRSTTRVSHQRGSSLSSLGSAGPVSPYTANTSNPQVSGDIYHDFEYQHSSSKPLTPAHTPSQEHFLTPHYSNIYQHSNLGFAMGHNELPKSAGADLMPAPELHSGRPSISTVASHDSPATPSSCDEERSKNGYRSSVPKLNRTMTDAMQDELYSPEQFSSPSIPSVTSSPQNDVFSQRLQAANSQHLSASNIREPLTIPSRERSPFCQGSPLAPTNNNFGSLSRNNIRTLSAQYQREQAKAANDERIREQQIAHSSLDQSTPRTVSPKDVDLVYIKKEQDANTPLFPPQQSQQHSQYRQQPMFSQEASEVDDTASLQSYGSMATTRRESSSAYSNSSQTTQQQGNYNFAPPAVPGNIRIPQQYPFISQSRRQVSNMSSNNDGLPSTLTLMESSSSDYVPHSEMKKPAHSAAETGTYSCTYHGCTLRFDHPSKLQRHKREGHRNLTSPIGGDGGGMTSAAQRNSQAGPHKCDRINPSTGKPCNTVFSRPYDLTRHEDTIHNSKKVKVHCPYCTEEKTFSRNDALTRHLRVVHPEHADQPKRRRNVGD